MINVKDFGAVGNGSTDDRVAIQTALDSVPGGGGTVFVPAGDYRLGDALTITKNGTTFTGEGATSILRMVDGVMKFGIGLPEIYNAVIDPTFFVSNVTISNMVVDGNHNPLPVSPQPNYFGIYAGQTSYLTLSNLIVKNWPVEGISISNGNAANDHLTVQNCFITGIGRNAIHVGFATNTMIQGNYITDTPSQYWGGSAASSIDVEVEGYDALGPSPHTPFVRYLTIQNNIIERLGATTSGTGIALQPAYGPLSNVTISNNVIYGHEFALQATGSLGLWGEVAGVHDITIQNNWMSVDLGFAVLGNPVQLAGSAIVNILNNITNDPTVTSNFSGGGVNGAVTVGAANNTEIENNTFRMFNGLAIANLYGASDTVIVTGNNYQTTGAVQVVNDGSATNVTVSGNVDITATPWDKTPPSVSFGITGGTVISSTTNITVTATDAGAGVARVFFFVDGVPQGFDDTAPYIFSLDPSQFTVGSHVLSSVAVDHAANFGSTEATVSVQVARSFVLNARGLSALRTGPYAIDAKFFRAIS